MRFAKLAFVITALSFLASGSLQAQDAKLVAEGKKVYSAKECAKCHMIAGKGNKIGKLDGIAGKLSEAEIRKWLTDPAEMEKNLEKKPKVKMSSKIKQMTLKDADVDVLVAYLKTLK